MNLISSQQHSVYISSPSLHFLPDLFHTQPRQRCIDGVICNSSRLSPVLSGVRGERNRIVAHDFSGLRSFQMYRFVGDLFSKRIICQAMRTESALGVMRVTVMLYGCSLHNVGIYFIQTEADSHIVINVTTRLHVRSRPALNANHRATATASVSHTVA